MHSDVERDIRVGRAHAYNEIGAHRRALTDAKAALMAAGNCGDAMIQAGWALYCLKRPKESMEYLVKCLQLIPDHAYASTMLQRCRQRLQEAENGKYNLIGMKDQLKERDFAIFECADFTKLVCKKKGPGKGAFVTEDVKAGVIVMARKAFVSCSPEESRMFGAYDRYLNELLVGHIPAVTRKMVQKVYYNIEQFNDEIFETLPRCEGYTGLRGFPIVDDRPVIDRYSRDLHPVLLKLI
jgi:tetratricopeptide (TPR) repeat protein